jgi:hypothetical protein
MALRKKVKKFESKKKERKIKIQSGSKKWNREQMKEKYN